MTNVDKQLEKTENKPTIWLKVAASISLGFFTVWLFLFLKLFSAVLVVGFVPEDMSDNIQTLIFTTSGSIAVIVVSWLVARWLRSSQSTVEYFKINKPHAGTWRHIVVYAIGLYLLYTVLAQLVFYIVEVVFPGINIDQRQAVAELDVSSVSFRILLAGVLVILTPLSEELVFRGHLYQLLKNFISVRSAIIVSSILFGVLHAEFFSSSPFNWAAVIDTGFFALFLGYVYEKTGSLWAPIMLHALKNAVAFYVLFIVG